MLFFGFLYAPLYSSRSELIALCHIIVMLVCHAVTKIIGLSYGHHLILYARHDWLSLEGGNAVKCIATYNWRCVSGHFLLDVTWSPADY